MIKTIIVFIIIILLFLLINYIISKKEYFDITEYDNIMLNNYYNNFNNLYKIGLNKNIPIYRDECFDKCNAEECIKLEEKRKWLKKCNECNKIEGKCFHKSIIGGNCDDCLPNEEKIDCYNIDNFGCTTPSNINNLQVYNGIEPYFLEVPDNNPNSPYNKKCVFCWDIMDSL